MTLRPDKTIANIAITLNRQTDSQPRKLIDHLKTEFLTHGGIKEEMYAARKEWRRQNQ
ncbi:four helix bundle suffix domain-containing protein [Xylanibacter rarus]|uniref:four helix bundle suffix domain-containing protein n=1 Tax=Xylanibacter rarus TaxID=1676614 RepID=UPI003FD6FA81